ncbi:hypothetical protein SLS63_004397 [Diaporthe eres]|uniref:Uncharacterized protein n=1 Tax=Diaporthe eres TaxID=83184 RepID=A0ABR1PDS0_DIAER
MPDEAVVGSVKRTATTQGRGPESQSKGPQPTEPQPMEPQSKEPQLIQLQTTDQDKRISEADVAAASRLAQAAIAAGLTGNTSEAGTPVDEDQSRLVRFTKQDLREVLSDAVIEDEIRQTMEPHWLARMEFLTWLERPAADMHHIKKQIRRLAVRWSKDLRNQDAVDVDIPISTLESWRADIVVVGGPSEDTDIRNAMDESGNTGDDKKGDENEGDKEDLEMGGDMNQERKEQGDEEEGDENEVLPDSHEVAETLAEYVTSTVRDMAEWKEAFNKEMAAEPNFRSKRAWAARVSESKREAKILEEKVWNLDVYKSECVTQATMQAADQLLDELQKFRIGLRMDREAFWDEFDQEGAEVLLGKTEIGQSAEETIQEVVQEHEAQDIVAEKEDIQMTELEAEVEDVQMTESEELQGSSTGDGGATELNPGPIERPSRVADDHDSNATTVKPEHPSDEEPAQEASPSVKREEPPPLPARVADLQSKDEVPKAQQRSPRSPKTTYAGKGIISSREEDKSGQPAELERQDREGQAAEAGEKLNSRGKTPWLPDKRGSHSPSWKWPGEQKEEAKVINPDATAAAEGDKPSHELGSDTSSALFSSRSVSAEEVSDEEQHIADQALTTSDLAGVPQNTSSMTSRIHVKGIERASSKADDTTDQTLATSSIPCLPQDTSCVASRSRSVSPEIISNKVKSTTDSSSTASDISSLPEDTGSSTPGRSEAGEEVEVENTVDRDSAAPNVPEDTSLSQETDPSTTGVRIESTEENGGRRESTGDTISPSSHVARLLQEVSQPQDTGYPTIGTPSRSVARIGLEPKEEEVDQTSSTNLPPEKSPTTSGIRSGSDAGVGGEVESTVDDHGATTSDAAGVPRGSNVAEDLEPPPAFSIGVSPIIVPNVRYIKPQWESLFSPEEPTFGANDFSANEADDGDDEDDQFYDIDEVDDREADDVDP